MRLLVVFYLILFSWQVSAQRWATPLRAQARVARRIEAPKPAIYNIAPFLSDTLRSDSFYKANYAKYLERKEQLNTHGEFGSTNNSSPTIKAVFRGNGFFAILAAIILLLLFIKFNFTKLYKNSFRSFYDRSATSEIVDDKYSPRWLFIFFTNLFFVLVVSLWLCGNVLTLALPSFENRMNQFLLVLALIAVVYFLKFTIHLLAGYLFQITESVIIYLLNVSITNLLSGILMLFLSLLLLYSPWHGQAWLFNISIGVFVFFVLIRYTRGLLQTAQYFKYNYLYLILYLCILEIAPWFLIIKYLNNYL